jgi:diguanylate cyclase (GGDEF)-like protein/PAS domain S-box-containing protein
MDADLFVDLDQPVRRAWHRQAWDRVSTLRLPRWIKTLKSRLLAGSLLALLLTLAAVTWQMARHAERGLLQQAEQRQLSDADLASAAVGRSLDVLKARLAAIAAQTPAADWEQPEAVTQALVRGLMPGSPFASVFAGQPGTQRWIYGDSAGLRDPGFKLADIAVVREVLEQRRAMVSAPVIGRLSGEPVVVLAQPVIRDGEVAAVFGGALRLASRDPLRDLVAMPVAATDRGLVVSDRDGRLLVHADRQRLARPMAEDPALAEAWAAWQARDVRDQRAVWTDERHVRAVAPVPGTPWLVWLSTPRSELVAPLVAARQQALVDAVVLAGLFTVLLAVFLGWQFKPLQRLERHAACLLAGQDAGEWPRADGEIGRLTRTLHHLWAERTQMEAFNAQVLQKLGSVMSAAPVGLAFTRNQSFELVSEELCRLLGRPESEVVGQRTQMIFLSNEDYAALGPQVASAFAAGHSYSGEWQLLRSDGSRFWALLRARPVAPERPEAGTIWSINDVSEQVAARRQLEHAAHHDALTGVVNRQGFELTLQALFEAQPGSRPASLVMIDLDHFKPINDTAGHAAGDAMLVAVAQAISTRVRDTDIVVRLGGDEFALLLPHCPHERALGVAEKVREAITDLALTWEAHTLRVGASLGVAELAEHHESVAQWMAQADAACYEAKRLGRGRVRLARPDLRVMSSGG